MDKKILSENQFSNWQMSPLNSHLSQLTLNFEYSLREMRLTTLAR